MIPIIIYSLVSLTILFTYKKFIKTNYIYFIFYLIFTILIEFFGFLFSDYLKINNNPIYTFYFIITFLFYFLFYKNIFRSLYKKRILNFIILFYLMFIIIDVFIFKTNYFKDFVVNNIIVGSILLVISIILFLVEIINNEEIVFNIKKSFIFWISLGLLLFYIGATPIMISSNYLNFEGIYDNILTILNIIMYGSFIIGFIKSDPKYNY